MNLKKSKTAITETIVAIISGGMQETARDIACMYPSESPWRRRWGGINRHRGCDTKFHVFKWLA